MKHWRVSFLALIVSCVPALAASQSETMALVNVRIIDGTGGPSRHRGIVLIRDGVITAVGDSASVMIPGDARRIDLSGQSIVPGFVDAHVHLSAVRAVRQTEFGPEDLRAFIAAGVTSIRSLGDATPWIFDLARDASARRITGPRIVSAGAMITAPGGHPVGTWLRGNAEGAAAFAREVVHPDSARLEVRRLVAGGATAIKAVFDSGAVRSPFGLLPRLSEDALRAVVAEARSLGVPSIVHVQSIRDLPAAIRASPDQLTHVPLEPLPDSLISALAASRITVVPTIAALAAVLPPPIVERILANVRLLIAARVPMVTGTDAPLGPAFGSGLHQEMELLVRAGMTPAQAIVAATRDAARALGVRDIGTIAPGMRADLVALDGDPEAAIDAVRRVRRVWIDGRLVFEAPAR